MRLRSRRLTVALVVTASVGIVALANPFSAGAQTTCSAAWNASTIYVGGKTASLDGTEYRAKWWTQNERPGTTGEWGVWQSVGACGGGGSPTPAPTPGPTPGPTPAPTPTPTPGPTPGPSRPPTDQYNIAYFTEWGVYGRNYHVKDLVTSGSAAKLTHIVYAFGNVRNGQCQLDDSYAAIDKYYGAAASVDGTSDTYDTGVLRGSFNQLRKLKQMYPHIKVVWSFGGWTYSSGFGQAAQNPAAFAQSCHDLIHDARWDGVFDGIDIDWEYPNACGLSCNSSGAGAYPALMQALRREFGDELVTSAITADGTSGGKIDLGGYGPAAQYVDFYMVMTYDYFGAWAAQGPTAPHSPLTSYNGIPNSGFTGDTAIVKLRTLGVPADKLLLGLGFYGRGWNGVTQSSPGGSASGAAAGRYEPGIDDYKVLKQECPATGQVAGTAYAHCGNEWWSYDTPATIRAKVDWANARGLRGVFFWEISGDTADGELVDAIHDRLK